MSGPAGPTGVITLKQIGDVTYEQYGAIVLSTTGTTQVTASSTALAQVFQPNIEQQMTWIEEFASRIQGSPNAAQSSFYNDQIACWPGGAWGKQNPGGLDSLIASPQATLSGAVRFGENAIAAPHSELFVNESSGTIQGTTQVNRNPTLYMRFAQTTVSGSGGVTRIGWGDINNNIAVAGLCFRYVRNSDIEGAASKASVTTTLSGGVTAADGVYHAGRIVVTGGGTSAEFFLDGVSIGTITTNIPTVVLGPRIEETEIAPQQTDLDYLACSQQRVP